jgi:hypothetical protein
MASHPPAIPPTVHIASTAQFGIDSSRNTQYQFTTIDVPGVSDTEAYGINNSGLVSGFYVVNGIGHGFLWRNGTFQFVDHNPGPDTLLGDVNEPGMVAGNYGSFTLQHAAIYSIGTGTWMQLPDIANLPINLGNGINPQGHAVGSVSMGTLAAPLNSTGWVWDGSKYSFFTVPGAAGLGTEAVSINAPGQVSGYFQDMSGSFHGFLKQGARITTVDVPAALDTFATGLNNSGEQVGYFVDSQGGTHGFVLSGGTFTTIDVPGSLATLVNGINEKGDLVGLWFDSSATHAFLASRH